MRVLVTRPLPEARVMARQWAAMGLRCEIAPLLREQRIPFDATQARQAGSLVFTSARAARCLAEMADWPALRMRPLYAVGTSTRAQLVALGAGAVRTGGQSARSLVELIDADRPPEPVVHICGKERSLDLAACLRGRGLATHSLAVYRMEALDRLPGPVIRQITGRDIVAAAVFSRRSAEVLWAALHRAGLDPAGINGDGDPDSNGGPAGNGGMKIFALSAQAAGPFAGHARLVIAPRPDAGALARTICAHIKL